jgi:hypothetical protein
MPPLTSYFSAQPLLTGATLRTSGHFCHMDNRDSITLDVNAVRVPAMDPELTHFPIPPPYVPLQLFTHNKPTQKQATRFNGMAAPNPVCTAALDAVCQNRRNVACSWDLHLFSASRPDHTSPSCGSSLPHHIHHSTEVQTQEQLNIARLLVCSSTQQCATFNQHQHIQRRPMLGHQHMPAPTLVQCCPGICQHHVR